MNIIAVPLWHTLHLHYICEEVPLTEETLLESLLVSQLKRMSPSLCPLLKYKLKLLQWEPSLGQNNSFEVSCQEQYCLGAKPMTTRQVKIPSEHFHIKLATTGQAKGLLGTAPLHFWAVIILLLLCLYDS